ncbi:MAG: type I restriction enzyme HsdR N-terminal domain-containing protein [Prevotella sp.]|nr:type I restriction enzyme HsdR N-terminal domain-containing protein [Candidatus Prevotella equi]
MNLPEYKNIRIKKTQNDKYEVFDVLRQRYVALTPEEWVRQHFVNYLITDLGYPKALMANEVELTVGEKHLRCDSVLFGDDRKPRMIMEYKAEGVPLTEKVITQVTTYNMLLHVDYLLVSNGNNHICLHLDREQNKWVFLSQIPRYNELTL